MQLLTDTVPAKRAMLCKKGGQLEVRRGGGFWGGGGGIEGGKREQIRVSVTRQ